MTSLVSGLASCSPLESLPAELRDQILSSVQDLPTLRSLVHASPVMHAQYMSNRDSLLRACVERELDGLYVHAYACLKSRVHDLGKFRTEEVIAGFLDDYRSWLPLGPSPRADLDGVDPSHIRWMAAFHLAVARPLTRIYSTWALANLARAATASLARERATEQQAAELAEGSETMRGVAQETTLSRSEEVRIMRALYQCETYHHLFGRNRGPRCNAFRFHEINHIFFSLFDPWESEAVGCIDMFVRQRYDAIFDEVQADLHHTSPRLGKPKGATNRNQLLKFEAEREGNYYPAPTAQAAVGSTRIILAPMLTQTVADYMENIVSRGLTFTVRLLAIDDHDTLVRRMKHYLKDKHNLDYPLKWSLDTLAQDDRRVMLGTNARDEAEARRDPIEFTGDTVPPAGPPLGWVLLWGGRYSNLCGEYVPRTVRQWGYVMWDEQRWTESGARGLVATQWETAPGLVDKIESEYLWHPSGLESSMSS